MDSFGRVVNYLRISLTEACNFRCVYCLPKEGFVPKPNSQALTRQEIVRLVRVMGDLGVNKVRLTGGEPLLRKDLVEIVEGIKKLGVIHDLSVTTNGSLLSKFLLPLKEAGLDRINISLDSLSPKRFAQVTLSNQFNTVFQSVFQALHLGFPVKLNTLVLQDLCDAEILRLVALAQIYPLEIRFLEFMPLCGEGWRQQDFRPIAEIRALIQENFELVEEGNRDTEVAEVFRLQGGKGKVGLISSVTEPFCNTCSRVRLTTDGKLRPCLFSTQEFSLKDLLRSGSDDAALFAAIRHAIAQKPRGNAYYEAQLSHTQPVFLPAENSLIRSLGG